MNLPKDWSCKTLGEVCAFSRGLTYKKKDEVELSRNVVLRANNIDLQGNRLNFDELKYIDDGIAIPDSKKLKRNSLLVCISSGSKKHLGKVAYIDDEYPYAFGGFMGMLTPKTQISPRFFYWFMQSKAYKDHLESLSDGLNINNLKFDQLKPLVIPLPPLPEQQRIVAILDDAFERIDAAIANTEKNLANARELFESYLNDVFAKKGEGWEEQPVDNLCESIIDCINKTAPKVDHETPFIMLRTTNVRNGAVNTDDVKYVSEETYRAWTRRQVPAYGDVLLTREAPMGEAGLILTTKQVFLGQRIVSYRVDTDRLDNRFLLYAFQSNTLQSQMKDVASGSTVQHIRVPETKRWIIPTPPTVQQQAAIADRLDSLHEMVSGLEQTFHQKLSALSELKQSILQKAFAGELTADMNQEALVN